MFCSELEFNLFYWEFKKIYFCTDIKYWIVVLKKINAITVLAGTWVSA